MKQLTTLLILLIVALATNAQQVPIIETTISNEWGNYSLTDKQLAAQETLIALQEKYGVKGTSYIPNTISDEDRIEVERLNKIIYPKEDEVSHLEEREYIWSTEQIGCSWYCGAYHFETSSSSLPNTAKNDYSVTSIADDDVRTAWVEGAKGYGIGEYVEVHFPMNYAQATDGYIVNGYNKNERTWRNNSRVKTMNLYIDDKFVAILNLKDTRDLQHFVLPDTIPNRKDTTAFRVRHLHEQDYKVSTLKFLITDVYRGDKYDDTAISELYFDGIGVHCIAEGAVVQMANKTTKSIQSIRVGDSVLAYENNSFAPAKVTAVHAVEHRTMYKIRLRDGKTIKVTDDHPFFTLEGWKSLNPSKTKAYARYKDLKVTALEESDTVKVLLGNDDTTSSEVIEIDEIRKKTYTYTLELETNAAFVANGILVGQE